MNGVPTEGADQWLRAEYLPSKWGWFFALGIVLTLCGTLAVALPAVSTFAASVVLGIALSFAGAVKMIQSLQVKEWSGFLLARADGRRRAGRGYPDIFPSPEGRSCDHARDRLGVFSPGPSANCSRNKGARASRLALVACFGIGLTGGQRGADFEVAIHAHLHSRHRCRHFPSCSGRGIHRHRPGDAQGPAMKNSHACRQHFSIEMRR